MHLINVSVSDSNFEVGIKQHLLPFDVEPKSSAKSNLQQIQVCSAAALAWQPDALLPFPTSKINSEHFHLVLSSPAVEIEVSIVSRERSKPDDGLLTRNKPATSQLSAARGGCFSPAQVFNLSGRYAGSRPRGHHAGG